MNNSEKKINVNVSSLVDLKAELVRKQQQLREERLLRKAGKKPEKKDTKKPSVWSKQNAGVLERAQKDLEQRAEEDDLIKKSRSTLEAKAKLYEQMTQKGTVPDDDGSEGFLVDFQGKALDATLAERQRQREEEEARDREAERRELEDVERRLSEAVSAPADPDEEWVDYIDSAGVSRRCMKKDLANLSAQEYKQVAKKLRLPDLMSADMHREVLRKKWEDEEAAMLEQPAGPVHYSNVRYDEVRTHGVGFYEFSKDEEERQKQMETLEKLREQTKDQRAKKESYKAKRKAILKARLAKVKQRRMVQEGGVLDQSSDEDDEDMIGPKPSEATEPELLTRDESIRKDAPVRDWDKGKKVEKKSYEEVRREERIDEFAPPSALYNEPSSSGTQRNYTPKLNLDHQVANPDPMKGLEETLNLSQTVDPMARLEANASANSDSVAAKQKDTGSAISKGLEAKEARKKMNFERFDELIGSKISSIRAQMDQEEVMSQSVTKEDVIDMTNTNNAVTNSGQMTSYSGISLPDMSVPPPGFVPPVYSASVASQYGYGSHEYSEAILAHNMNDDLSGIDFSRPPPPPPGIQPTQTPLPHSLNPHPVPQNPYPAYQPESTKISPARQSQSSQTSSRAVISAAPQLKAAKPVFYDRNRGMMPDIVKQAPRYERVHLHEVPGCLPAPPLEGRNIEYPSQEQVHGVKKQEEASVNAWSRQYSHDKSTLKVDSVKTQNIPFVSPFVQNKSLRSQNTSSSDGKS